MAESEPKQTSTRATSSSGATSPSGKAGGSVTGSASTEAGYYGTATDPTPRENYALDGVTGGKPTPETDSKSAEAARKARG